VGIEWSERKMKSLVAGDDEIQILEIQNGELLRENEILRSRLAKIEKSRSYKFAEALKGSSEFKRNDALRRSFRIVRLGSQLIRERARNFFFRQKSLTSRFLTRRPASD
jgi:hypothetical protein